MRPIKLFVVCPGLGNINRGYETFARECFDALSTDDRLETYLFKGAGPAVGLERPIWNLDRQSRLAGLLGLPIRRSGYYVEQMTFGLSLLPHIVRLKPDVIFFSDLNLRSFLWYWRRMTRQPYRLLLSNGGPVGPPFPRCEHVHQVVPGAIEEAVQAGHPADRQSFVPYGFLIERTFQPMITQELRSRLGIDLDRPVLLSVGAINASHKRMDYVIRELASLPEPRPYLLLLGQVENETAEIVGLANDRLGPKGFRCLSVPQTEMPLYYRMADAFVLASLSEGFGRAYVEALANGLACFAHDYPAARFILGDYGQFANFRNPGALAAMIVGMGSRNASYWEKEARHQSAFTRFSWTCLKDRYVAMIQSCAEKTVNNDFS